MCEQCKQQDEHLERKFYKDLQNYDKNIDWNKTSGTREFDQRETLVKAKKYLETAETQGFGVAYAQLEADIAKLDWFLARVSLALEEKSLKQKAERWLNAIVRFEHTKNACHPCDTGGQVSEGNSYRHGNTTGRDTAQPPLGLSSGNIQLCGTGNRDVKYQCNKCVGNP